MPEGQRPASPCRPRPPAPPPPSPTASSSFVRRQEGHLAGGSSRREGEVTPESHTRESQSSCKGPGCLKDHCCPIPRRTKRIFTMNTNSVRTTAPELRLGVSTSASRSLHLLLSDNIRNAAAKRELMCRHAHPRWYYLHLLAERHMLLMTGMV